MRRLLLIGIGAGDPGQLTFAAVAALNAASVFFVFDKGAAKEELTLIRQAICARFIAHADYRFVAISDPQRDTRKGYRKGVETWHRARAERVRAAIETEIPAGGCGAFLVWGDPSLYDSTLRVLEQALAGSDLEASIEIIPGISSVQLLAARHKICLNDIGEPVHITTGRKLSSDGMPAGGASVIVMLDGDLACRNLIGHDLDIYWGACLGTPDEVLVAGRLDDVIGEIEKRRSDLKAHKGWVMDTYLLRRRGQNGKQQS